MSRLDIERVDVVFGNALCGILPGEWYLVLHCVVFGIACWCFLLHVGGGR